MNTLYLGCCFFCKRECVSELRNVCNLCSIIGNNLDQIGKCLNLDYSKVHVAYNIQYIALFTYRVKICASACNKALTDFRIYCKSD